MRRHIHNVTSNRSMQHWCEKTHTQYDFKPVQATLMWEDINTCLDEPFKTQLLFKAKFKTWSCSIYRQCKLRQFFCINPVTIRRITANNNKKKIKKLTIYLHLYTAAKQKKKNLATFWLCLKVTFVERGRAKLSCWYMISTDSNSNVIFKDLRGISNR